MSRVPKYVINPEYLKSASYQRKLEEAKASIPVCGYFTEDFFPEEYGKQLPKEGGWIILLASVHVGDKRGDTDISIDVPHLSIWYALPTHCASASSLAGIDMHMKQAIIQTPQGAVHIWPHEYNVIPDITKYLEFTEEDGLKINWMKPGDGFDEQKLLYIRSRGIPLAEARRMLIGEIKSPHVLYLTFHESVGAVFPEWTGGPTSARKSARPELRGCAGKENRMSAITEKIARTLHAKAGAKFPAPAFWPEEFRHKYKYLTTTPEDRVKIAVARIEHFIKTKGAE